jgi:hypothetical protein
MRNITGALCASVLALGSLLIAQTSGGDAAATVLAEARKALGGEQKIAGVKSVLATGRTRQVRGDNLVPIEFEIAIELPDRYVRKDEIPAQESGPTLTGFSGTELIQFPPPGAPGGRGAPVSPERGSGPARAGGPPTPEQQEAARRMRLAGVKQDFVRLTLGMFAASFASAPLTFSYVAKAEAPDGKADVIAVTGPDNFSARLFVNADTHLPIMLTWTQPGPARGMPRGGPVSPERGGVPAREGGPPGREGGGPSPVATPPPESRLFYADYRDVSGLKLPFRLRRALGADTIEETTFDSFKINSKIDPKKFEVRK